MLAYYSTKPTANWITRTIGDIIISNIHRCTSPNVRRLLCFARCCSAIFSDISLSPMALGNETSGEYMHWIFFSVSRCIGEAWRLLAYVADHFPNYQRIVALPWRCPNLCIAKASRGIKSTLGIIHGIMRCSASYILLGSGHTKLLRRWINGDDVNSTSQQSRVPSGIILVDRPYRAMRTS